MRHMDEPRKQLEGRPERGIFSFHEYTALFGKDYLQSLKLLSGLNVHPARHILEVPTQNILPWTSKAEDMTMRRFNKLPSTEPVVAVVLRSNVFTSSQSQPILKVTLSR